MSTPTSNIQTDLIWYKNLQILVRSDRITEFIPITEQTLEERINSIVRFGLYVSILLSVYNRDAFFLMIFPSFMILSYIIYKKYNKELFEEVTDKTKKQMKIKKEIKPTLNNPFMNTLMTDYVENPEKSKAPTYFEDTKQAEEMRNDISSKFKHDLYMGIDDVYEKNNSQRQFYTTPSTGIPSDQEAYLNFMYPNMTSCKSDSKDCKINEDLRGRPYIFPEQEKNPN
jgi:hypothetical protein